MKNSKFLLKFNSALRGAIVILFLLFAFSNSAQSQTSNCTNIKFNLDEYKKLTELSRFLAQSRSSNPPKVVPVHFFVLRHSEATRNNKITNLQLQNAINSINGYFLGSNISLELCKATYIDNDQLFDLSLGLDQNGYPTARNALLTGNNLDPEALCI